MKWVRHVLNMKPSHARRVS